MRRPEIAEPVPTGVAIRDRRWRRHTGAGRSSRTAVGGYDAAATAGGTSLAASCGLGCRNASQDRRGDGGRLESGSSSGSGERAVYGRWKASYQQTSEA